MSQPEEEFLRRLRATFIVEANEHVEALSAGILALEEAPAAPATPAAIETIFRHAHSLKGAARATNAFEIESICQSLETVFAEWKRQRIKLRAEEFDTLHHAVDLISKRVPMTGSPASPEDAQKISAVLRQLARLASGETPAPAPAPERRSESASIGASVSPLPPPPAASVPSAEATRRSAPAAARELTETIRISTAKLDRLLLNAEETLVLKQNTAQRAADLRPFEPLLAEWATRWTRLQPQLRELRRGGTMSATASTALAEFLDWNSDTLKSIESRLRALAKSTTQDHYEAAKRVDDLLAETKQLVMLPFATLTDFFPKLVRELSRDQGKEVSLVVRGGEVEIDKRILEEMKDALIHLVRNAIDHGVETPSRRVQQGKPACATVTLAAVPIDGNKVEILVSDDGGGIDLGRVKESAVKRGVLSPLDAPSFEDRKSLDLIFHSEISTSPIITEISGRGLGLAIVREKTEKLGGRIVVETQRAGGTSFRIKLPLTLTTFRGVLVRAAGATFVIPTAQVERVTRVKTSDTKTVENRETISLHGRAVSLVRLNDVLELALQNENTTPSNFITVVLLGRGEEQIAFAVDDVLHDEEVLVKSLRRPLSRVRNIAGATVLATGQVALVLNAADMLKSARKAGGPRRAVKETTTTRRGGAPKRILMAEDSITSRMLLKGILESAGYEVKTAVDGLEAWTLLRSEDFNLVVSDVEMPRLNGFDLTAQIRGDKKLADKPVVLVTALASQEDRERGIDVGANAYIVKSSFDQSNLLDVVRRLV